MGKFKAIIDEVFSRPDNEIRDRAENENLQIMHLVSLLFAISEVFAICLFFLLGNGHYMKSFSVRQAIIGFSINLIYHICSKAINYKVDKSLTKKIYQGAYFISLIIWSLNISYYHYTIGEQITIMYMILVGITCFVTLAPRFSIPLISIPVIILYILMYRYDGARGMIAVNYFSFGIMFMAGSFIRYKLKIRSLNQMRELERINIALDREAREDPITGLRNRLCLSNDYDNYHGHRLCVIMIDIDYFKRYNDTYGHQIGDLVLKDIANATIEAFSKESSYRYGGDELMVVVKDPTEKYINQKLKQWLDLLSNISIEGVPHTLTCSYGYAMCEVYSTDDFLKLQKLADEMLYENKKNRPKWDE
ncbi:GGDEF domain-containing protein [Oribacterium sp. WCC10]|uniref:GGDEF domain-containing protein n=1 Tax=Oribacterium sp. WCC10 TaxID=1855343 RepID=UPI0008EFBF62|nr:sensor domain-containing diguanylate cyclase [Oribacterium sp. WCC10]SFG51539.1 diguanylate cyclase (GGDEF) domain-containing protein [Oribacterium sp. WCC10]